MKLTPFEEKKKQFDTALAFYLSHRVFTDLKDTDAFKEGIIDGVGNVLKANDPKAEWAFTPFDKLVLALKQHFSEDKLKELLEPFKESKEIDPLRIMNSTSPRDFSMCRTVAGRVVSALEGQDYLPSDLEYKEEFLQDESKSFVERASLALTQASFLLFALVNDKTPSHTDFTFNVIASTELTFHSTAIKDYNRVYKPLKDAELVDDKHITNKGIRMLVSLAKIMDSENFIIHNPSRVENQYQIWQKLSRAK